MAYKVFNEESLSALLDIIKNTKDESEDTSSDLSSLYTSFKTFVSTSTTTLVEIDEALEELDNGKETKSIYYVATISADGWVDNTDTDTAELYPYSYSLTVDDASASDDSADCIVYQTTIENADVLCPTCDVVDGAITFYAEEAPDGDIIMQIRLIKG